MSELAGHRAHLDLQINLPTEQKVAKILEILAWRPGDGEDVQGRGGADDLTQPADPEAPLEATKKSASD